MESATRVFALALLVTLGRIVAKWPAPTSATNTVSVTERRERASASLDGQQPIAHEDLVPQIATTMVPAKMEPVDVTLGGLVKLVRVVLVLMGVYSEPAATVFAPATRAMGVLDAKRSCVPKIAAGTVCATNLLENVHASLVGPLSRAARGTVCLDVSMVSATMGSANVCLAGPDQLAISETVPTTAIRTEFAPTPYASAMRDGEETTVRLRLVLMIATGAVFALMESAFAILDSRETCARHCLVPVTATNVVFATRTLVSVSAKRHGRELPVRFQIAQESPWTALATESVKLVGCANATSIGIPRIALSESAPRVATCTDIATTVLASATLDTLEWIAHVSVPRTAQAMVFARMRNVSAMIGTMGQHANFFARTTALSMAFAERTTRDMEFVSAVKVTREKTVRWSFLALTSARGTESVLLANATAMLVGQNTTITVSLTCTQSKETRTTVPTNCA